MVYRVLIGFIPMIFAALILTGTIPLGALMPTQEYRSSAVRAAEAKEEAEEATKANAERRAERAHPGEMPSVGEAFRMHAEISSDVARMEREERQGTFREVAPRRPPGWKPKAGGWGPQETKRQRPPL
jgi:hypothetical protein